MDNRPIYWFEGLFLRPQHFQQQDLFHQAQLQSFTSIAVPYQWGINQISIVQSALNNQIFEIEKCSMIFPDGSCVSYPGNSQLNYRSFEGKWDNAGEPLPIYIGMRKLTYGDSNVATVGEGDRPSDEVTATNRYWLAAKSTPTYDIYADRQQEGIQYLLYNLAIFFGDEATQASDFHLVKVAELERLGNEIRLSEKYAPPSLNVFGSSVLTKLMRDVKEQLTSRCRDLSLYKQELAEGAAMGSRDIAYLFALNALNRFVPLIHHLTEIGHATPWDTYGLLRQIVGELSTLSTGINVFGANSQSNSAEDGLLPYKHEDLWSCFKGATDKITMLLNELTSGPDYASYLAFDGTYYGTEIIDRAFQGNNRYFLRVGVENTSDHVIHDLQSTAKLSSREYLPIIIARALPGIGVNYLQTPPNELPRRQDSVYFELDHHGEAWNAIREGRNVAIYFDNPPADIDVEILVIYG